jgi:hypothetical protein
MKGKISYTVENIEVIQNYCQLTGLTPAQLSRFALYQYMRKNPKKTAWPVEPVKVVDEKQEGSE